MDTIRDIAARFRLTLYVASVIVTALFHYHTPEYAMNEGGKVEIVACQATVKPPQQFDADDHCMLCKLASSKVLFLSNGEIVHVESVKSQIVISFLVVKRLVIDSLLQRGPPAVV